MFTVTRNARDESLATGNASINQFLNRMHLYRVGSVLKPPLCNQRSNLVPLSNNSLSISFCNSELKVKQSISHTRNSERLQIVAQTSGHEEFAIRYRGTFVSVSPAEFCKVYTVLVDTYDRICHFGVII